MSISGIIAHRAQLARAGETLPKLKIEKHSAKYYFEAERGEFSALLALFPQLKCQGNYWFYGVALEVSNKMRYSSSLLEAYEYASRRALKGHYDNSWLNGYNYNPRWHKAVRSKPISRESYHQTSQPTVPPSAELLSPQPFWKIQGVISSILPQPIAEELNEYLLNTSPEYPALSPEVKAAAAAIPRGNSVLRRAPKDTRYYFA